MYRFTYYKWVIIKGIVRRKTDHTWPNVRFSQTAMPNKPSYFIDFWLGCQSLDVLNMWVWFTLRFPRDEGRTLEDASKSYNDYLRILKVFSKARRWNTQMLKSVKIRFVHETYCKPPASCCMCDTYLVMCLLVHWGPNARGSCKPFSMSRWQSLNLCANSESVIELLKPSSKPSTVCNTAGKTWVKLDCSEGDSNRKEEIMKYYSVVWFISHVETISNG